MFQHVEQQDEVEAAPRDLIQFSNELDAGLCELSDELGGEMDVLGNRFSCSEVSAKLSDQKAVATPDVEHTRCHEPEAGRQTPNG